MLDPYLFIALRGRVQSLYRIKLSQPMNPDNSFQQVLAALDAYANNDFEAYDDLMAEGFMLARHEIGWSREQLKDAIKRIQNDELTVEDAASVARWANFMRQRLQELGRM